MQTPFSQENYNQQTKKVTAGTGKCTRLYLCIYSVKGTQSNDDKENILSWVQICN